MRPPLKDCNGVNCPLGIPHPPPNADHTKGGVFPLGCGICRSEKVQILKNTGIKQVVTEENMPKALIGKFNYDVDSYYGEEEPPEDVDPDRP